MSYYLQTADLDLSESDMRKLKAKIEKIAHSYVMLKDENGDEL